MGRHVATRPQKSIASPILPARMLHPAMAARLHHPSQSASLCRPSLCSRCPPLSHANLSTIRIIAPSTHMLHLDTIAVLFGFVFAPPNHKNNHTAHKPQKNPRAALLL